MRTWIVSAALLALPAGALALPVFDNGVSPGQLVAGDVGFADATAADQRLADDFTFAGATTVDGVRFYGAYYAGNAQEPDAFTIQFYADASGLPGGSIGAPIVFAATRTDTGFNWAVGGLGPIDIFQYDASFATVDFEPGTYWLSILNSTPTGGNDFVLIALQATGGMAISQDEGASWAPLGESLAFVLLPEPGTLLLVGCAAAEWLRRRR